jgi:hypothetical protein
MSFSLLVRRSLIGNPKLFIGGKVSATNSAPQPTVNNFGAALPHWALLRPFHLRLFCGFLPLTSRPPVRKIRRSKPSPTTQAAPEASPRRDLRPQSRRAEWLATGSARFIVLLTRAMNAIITVGGAFVVLLVAMIALVLVARATKWKPKPVKPICGILAICATVLSAGVVCSIAGNDIHILYWWLVGIPIAAVVFPVCFAVANLSVRLLRTCCYFVAKWRRKN